MICYIFTILLPPLHDQHGRCFTSDSDWEYCNVPFCANDTKNALALGLANGADAFHYETCDNAGVELYGENLANAVNFTLWVSTWYAREGEYQSELVLTTSTS